MPLDQPRQLHPAYRSDIDGLRAIAVLSVVAFHAFPDVGATGGGFIGVDIFFVISGYLISSIIFRNLDKGIFSFADFYARRVRRIFPALVLVLAVGYALGWFLLLPDEFKQLGRHIAAGAVFASNFQLWSESGYFDTSGDTKPLLHLWSLGIEEQFYVVWPLLLFLARTRTFRLLLVGAIIAVSFYLNITGVQKNAVATFYSPQTRFWELLCGSMLAWLMLYRPGALDAIAAAAGARMGALAGRPLKVDGTAFGGAVSSAGLLILAFGFVRIHRDLGFPGLWAAVPVLGAVLIIAAGPEAWPNRIVLSHPVAVWFGLISYPLYLWHWPLLSFARIVGSEFPNGSARVAAVVAAVGLAWLTYRLVERPVRQGRGGAARIAVLAAALALLGSTGYATYLMDGLGFRQSATFQDLDGDVGQQDYYRYLSRHHHVCTPAVLADEAPRWEGFIRCMQSKPGPDVDIALIGDSHAEHLFLGIADALPDRNVAFYIKVAAPFSGQPEFQNIFRHVIASRSIRHVVLTMFWEAHLTDVPAGSSLENEISRTIDMLTRAGKKVYLTDDVPNFHFTGTDCKRFRWFGWKNVKCETSAEQVWRHHDRYIAALRKAVEGRPDARLLETMRYLCDGAVCSMTRGNELFYRDQHHLNINGSLFVGRKLVEDNPGIFN